MATSRNFYGTLRCRKIAGDTQSLHITNSTTAPISHGIQYLAPQNRRFPQPVYHPGSGIGVLLAPPAHRAPANRRRGTGLGTLAAYAEANDHYQFYEINPQVVEFAERYFSFLSDARDRFATIDIVSWGTAAVAGRRDPQNFDVLALDAFTGDAIPAHLLTREAFDAYLRHLRMPDGILALHISHRYLDFSRVVKAVAAERGLAGCSSSTRRRMDRPGVRRLGGS